MKEIEIPGIGKVYYDSKTGKLRMGEVDVDGSFVLRDKERGIMGYFKLMHIHTGKHEDAHTGEIKEVYQACLSWELKKNGKKSKGYKFNPFPLEDAIELAFSHVR